MENPFQELFQRLDRIDQILSELMASNPSSTFIEDDIFDINQASQFVHLSKATLYYLSSKCKIPVNKKGKRLYFSKSELVAWLKSGRRKTIEEIMIDGETYIQKRKAIRKP